MLEQSVETHEGYNTIDVKNWISGDNRTSSRFVKPWRLLSTSFGVNIWKCNTHDMILWHFSNNVSIAYVFRTGNARMKIKIEKKKLRKMTVGRTNSRKTSPDRHCYLLVFLCFSFSFPVRVHLLFCLVFVYYSNPTSFASFTWPICGIYKKIKTRSNDTLTL